MRILVLGSGGREHAIAWTLAKSSRCEALFVGPGNGGTEGIRLASGGESKNVSLDPMDGDGICDFCREEAIDLVAIGPEAPLVAGVADVLRDAGFLVYGPGAADARLEGSKDFAKHFMQEHGIPSAAYATFADAESAKAYVEEHGAPIVVKADGLAAGKGVTVAASTEEAIRAIDACFSGAFGDAGTKVVIEECMLGPECSMLSFVAGGTSFPMAPSQDHKRAYDNDEGPNTGGMGAYSPVPVVNNEELARMQQIMSTAAAASLNYRGTLYGGFMLTDDGPKIVEFNVRFGDPETQVVLPRLESDLVGIMEAVARGETSNIDPKWADTWMVCVVLASAGYPGQYEKGKVIGGLEEASAIPGVTIFHAGTKRDGDGQIVTSGGRVLDVCAQGATFEEARNLAYAACDKISFEGKQLRHDIGASALAGQGA